MAAKIRLGFVSNSSSSSFCLYGIRLGETEMHEFVKNNFQDNSELLDALENYDDEPWEFGEVLQQQGIPGVQIIPYIDCSIYYVGKEFKNIKDNETGKEFKESVEKIISEKFPGKKCSTMDVEIHD